MPLKIPKRAWLRDKYNEVGWQIWWEWQIWWGGVTKYDEVGSPAGSRDSAACPRHSSSSSGSLPRHWGSLCQLESWFSNDVIDNILWYKLWYQEDQDQLWYQWEDGFFTCCFEWLKHSDSTWWRTWRASSNLELSLEIISYCPDSLARKSKPPCLVIHCMACQVT